MDKIINEKNITRRKGYGNASKNAYRYSLELPKDIEELWPWLKYTKTPVERAVTIEITKEEIKIKKK